MDAIGTADRIAFEQGAEAANEFVGRTGVRIYNAKQRVRARGAGMNPAGRYERYARVEDPAPFDGDVVPLEEMRPFKTEVTDETPRTVISKNASPDLSFDRSINPYRGCEQGCVYCYARPTHAYVGLSAGLDFEQKIFAKQGAADVLRRELAAKNYEPKTIALGASTDPYQPIEKKREITRRILEVLDEANHPVGIVTKSALVTRDVDILSRMAKRGLVKVAISITTLDPVLARKMEPRAPSPAQRLEAIRTLSDAGVPVSVMVAPIIPGLTDFEVERILEAAATAGASEAGYVMLRLPKEVATIFKEWLLRNCPDRYRHVLSLLRSMRGGKDYDAEFGKRHTGMGPYAWQIGRRFEIATRRLNLNIERRKLSADAFVAPAKDSPQLALQLTA